MKANAVFAKDPRWTKLQLQCREYRLQGLTYAQIAEKTGKSQTTIQNTCIRIGMRYTGEEAKRAQDDGHKKLRYSEEDIRRMLRENGQEFEFVKAYGNSDGYVDLRCLWCGNIIRRSMQQVRKGKRIQCSYCKQGGEWERLRKEIGIVSSQFEEMQKAEKKKVKRPSVLKQCKQCGKMFWASKANAVCCSKECTKKQQNKNADSRLNKENIVDTDITLEKVYARDKGICYICGKPCDRNDYKEKEGIIVCGNNYPSIDHVVPLAKGGKHEWSNVRLAHRICNSYKADK